MKGFEKTLNIDIKFPSNMSSCFLATSGSSLNREIVDASMPDIGAVEKEEVDIMNVTDDCLDDPKYAKKIKEKLLNEFYPTAFKKAPKPANMSHSQYLNYLAIHILEETGNEFPTQKAIDFVESVLKNYYRRLNQKQRLKAVGMSRARPLELGSPQKLS